MPQVRSEEADATRPAEPAASPPEVLVWSRTVRVLHGMLIAAVSASALGLVAFFGLHRPAGWIAFAIVVVRAVVGFVGHGPVRFDRFVRGPRASAAHAVDMLRRREPRHVGHNPLGGWMVLALMACIAGLALTGWLYTTDLLFGDETVEAVHVALAWTLLGLVVLHVAGVVFTGRRHGENLVLAMVTGRKRPPGPNDID